jgi:hypothetical protein
MLPDEARMAVRNLVTAPPLGRLKALRELGPVLRDALDELVDDAELEAVRALRSGPPRRRARWESIGRAIRRQPHPGDPAVRRPALAPPRTER